MEVLADGYLARKKEKLAKKKQESDGKQLGGAGNKNPDVLRQAVDNYVGWLNADSVDEAARFGMMSNPKSCVCPELDLAKLIRGKLPHVKFTMSEVCVNESGTMVSLLLHCKEETRENSYSCLCAFLTAIEAGEIVLRGWE